jgi:hypothetical protein
VLEDSHFLLMNDSQSQIAATLVVDVLLIHLAHVMLTEFEKLEDLDGIYRICNFMERLHKRMKDQGVPIDEDGSGNTGRHWSSIEQASRDLTDRLFSNTNQADPFKVLEKVLQDDTDSTSSFCKQKQQKVNKPNHPLANLMGTSHSNSRHTTPDGTVVQAERTIDAYFIQGDIAASLACALVLVEDQNLAAVSTHADRIRLWSKASLIAECTLAQRNLLSAGELIEGVRSTLIKKQYRTSVIKNKIAMLSYLAEACTLLEPCKRLFPKASEVLKCLAYNVTAMVHQSWFDSDTASKWTVAAKAREEAAEFENDDAGAILYAREWLLNEENKNRKDALKCTKGWHAMVATLTL